MPSETGDRAARPATGARRLATPREVASYLQVPVKTLYTWRYKRVGPRAHRVGRHLRYRWEDVEGMALVDGRWVSSTGCQA
jgi:excisionase family DNA binding protein